MPKRGSELLDFIVTGLRLKKYINLKWVDENCQKFALECPSSRNKRWTKAYIQIYEDWDKKKNRIIHDGDVRSRFMSALKKSAYLTYCETESTTSRKIYQIKQSVVFRGSGNFLSFQKVQETKTKASPLGENQNCQKSLESQITFGRNDPIVYSDYETKVPKQCENKDPTFWKSTERENQNCQTSLESQITFGRNDPIVYSDYETKVPKQCENKDPTFWKSTERENQNSQTSFESQITFGRNDPIVCSDYETEVLKQCENKDPTFCKSIERENQNCQTSLESQITFGRNDPIVYSDYETEVLKRCENKDPTFWKSIENLLQVDEMSNISNNVPEDGILQEHPPLIPDHGAIGNDSSNPDCLFIPSIDCQSHEPFPSAESKVVNAESVPASLVLHSTEPTELVYVLGTKQYYGILPPNGLILGAIKFPNCRYVLKLHEA